MIALNFLNFYLFQKITNVLVALHVTRAPNISLDFHLRLVAFMLISLLSALFPLQFVQFGSISPASIGPRSLPRKKISVLAICDQNLSIIVLLVRKVCFVSLIHYRFNYLKISILLNGRNSRLLLLIRQDSICSAPFNAFLMSDWT